MSERPEYGTEDYRRYAALFNDITHAPTDQFVHFGTRNAIADYLWAQGWRREVRPEDVTGPPPAQSVDLLDPLTPPPNLSTTEGES